MMMLLCFLSQAGSAVRFLSNTILASQCSPAGLGGVSGGPTTPNAKAQLAKGSQGSVC